MFSKKEKEATTDEKVAQIKEKGRKGRAKTAAIGLGTTALADAAILGPGVVKGVKQAKESAGNAVIVNKVANTATNFLKLKKDVADKIKSGTASKREIELFDKIKNKAVDLRETEEFIRNHDKKTMKAAEDASKKAGRKAMTRGALLMAIPLAAAGISVIKANKKLKSDEDKEITKLKKGSKK